MARTETWFDQDLKKPVSVRIMAGVQFSEDNQGSLIGVRVYDDGADATLTGGATGYCILADGQTITVDGTREGNTAYILLPQSALVVPGPIQITIKLVDDSVITTLLACVGTVIRTKIGVPVVPGSVIEEWSEQISETLQECVDDCQAAAENLGQIVATPYQSLTYPVPLGKYTYYNGNIYRCVSPIASSEIFNPAHWSADINLGDEVSDLKSAIVKMTEPTSNLWEWGDFLNFTTMVNIDNVNIPAGTYMFSAVVTSNATANQVSSFYLYHSDSSITTVELNRNTRSGRGVTVPQDIIAIRLYASNTYSNSNGKVASWRDIGIFPQGTPAAYYVPYRMPVDIVARGDIESLEDFDEQIGSRVETLENLSAIDNPLLHKITETTENLWPFGDQSFTTSKIVGNISLPAGTYTISAIVESSDTVSTSSKMNLNHEGGTCTEVFLNRDARSGRHVTVSSPVVSVSVFASNTYSNSVGKTASWSDIAIFAGNVDVNYFIAHETAIDHVARQNSDRNRFTDYWEGKKIVWFGTSIPAGVVNAGDSGGNGSYPVRIGNMLGATVYNESVGSSCVRFGNYRFITEEDPHGLAGQWLTNFLYCLSASSTEKQDIFDNWNYWKNIITEGSQSSTVLTDDQKTAAKNCSYDIKLGKYLTGGSVGPVDLYVFDHGHNDEYSGWGSHTYPGYDEIKTDPPANDPANRSYFIGAMRYIINLILQDNPKAKILFIGHYENDRKTGISEAQEHLHDIWKFPLIRTWEYMGWSQNQVTINGVTKTITQIWMPDDLHPASDTTGEALTHYAEVLYPLIRDIR